MEIGLAKKKPKTGYRCKCLCIYNKKLKVSTFLIDKIFTAYFTVKSMTNDLINLIYEVISKCFISAKCKHNVGSEEPRT